MRNARCLVFFIILGLILSGCGILPCRSSDDDTPPETATEPQPFTATPTDTETPKKPSEVEPPINKPDPETSDEDLEIPDIPLSRDGPWWVFSTPEGLFAVNPDGSGLTQFYFGGDNSSWARQILVSPDGSHLAYLVGEGFNATLRINQLPWLTLITEKPLLSISSDLDMEALRAVVEQPSLAFSPDGTFLAFIGAIEGPSSDLYLFSLDNFEVTRLTDGPSQAFQPVWSPDGKYIVHTGVRSFGSGAGYEMSGIWASRTDNADAITLYDPSGSGSEVILGWVDNQTFIVYSWSPLCGSHLLRTFNIETQQSAILWKESFRAIAFNPSDKVVLLTSNKGECSPEAGAGMYFIPTNEKAPIRILETTGPEIFWSENVRLFLASGDFGAGVIAVDSKGQFIDLDMPQGAQGFPAVAPVSRDLAWKGESLWVGTLLGSLDNPPKAIFNEPVHTVTWTPDGQSVIFFAESGLFIAHQPDYTPIRITDGLDNQNGYSEWITP